jgi:hypothetical protein
MNETCGMHVKVVDLLRLLPTVVNINGKQKEEIKLVHLMDGTSG